MERKFKFWQCPQDGAHYFDWDDWRIQQNYWTGKAKCPEDHRELEVKVYTVEVQP